jgi:hypothetical protein
LKKYSEVSHARKFGTPSGSGQELNPNIAARSEDGDDSKSGFYQWTRANLTIPPHIVN